jgi:hypothetical protein
MIGDRARFFMSPELLAQRIGLPDGIRIVGVEWEQPRSSIGYPIIVITDDQEPSRLPKGDDGETPPMIEPIVTRQPEFLWDFTKVTTR